MAPDRTGLRRGTGLATNLLGIDIEEQMFSGQYRGSLYENAVMVEIIKRHQALGREPRLFYWRDSNKKEIDAILEQGGRPRYAVEVKSSATYNPKSFAILEDLAPMMDVPTEGRFVVYGGDEASPSGMARSLAWVTSDGSSHREDRVRGTHTPMAPIHRDDKPGPSRRKNLRDRH